MRIRLQLWTPAGGPPLYRRFRGKSSAVPRHFICRRDSNDRGHRSLPERIRYSSRCETRRRLHTSPSHSTTITQSPTTAQTMSSSRASAPPQHVSLLAGMAAGGIEGFVTYPAEFAKTRAQFVASGASGTGRVSGKTPSLCGTAWALITRMSTVVGAGSETVQ
jgi:hypothetical protein